MVFHRNRFWIAAALFSVFLFSGLAWGASGKVDINTATADELSTLDGIGPAKANSIVDYRKRHGAFKRPEDLMNVSGIGSKTFESNRDRITLGSPAPSASGGGKEAQSAGNAGTNAKTSAPKSSGSAGSPPAKQ